MQLEEEKQLVVAQQQSYEQELARLGSQLEEETALLEKEKALMAVQRQSYEQRLARPSPQPEEEEAPLKRNKAPLGKNKAPLGNIEVLLEWASLSWAYFSK